MEASHPENKKTEQIPAQDGKGKDGKEEPKPKPHPAHTQVCTWMPDMGVEVAIGESGINAVEPITVGQLFKKSVKRFSMHPALKYKEDGTWKSITYTGYYNLCIKAAKSFLKVRMGTAMAYKNVPCNTSFITPTCTI